MTQLKGAQPGELRFCPIQGCGWADSERSWYREHLAQHSDDGQTRKKIPHPPEVKQKKREAKA